MRNAGVMVTVAFFAIVLCFAPVVRGQSANADPFAAIQTQIEEQQARATQSEAEIDELQATTQAIAAKVADHATVLPALQEQVSEIDADLAEVETQTADQETRITDLESAGGQLLAFDGDYNVIGIATGHLNVIARNPGGLTGTVQFCPNVRQSGLASGVILTDVNGVQGWLDLRNPAPADCRRLQGASIRHIALWYESGDCTGQAYAEVTAGPAPGVIRRVEGSHFVVVSGPPSVGPELPVIQSHMDDTGICRAASSENLGVLAPVVDFVMPSFGSPIRVGLSQAEGQAPE